MGALSPGQIIAGTSYQVVRELGSGGMGVVYEIEHVRLKKRYVAKVIHEQIRNDAGAAKRMEREAQVLAAISHPNIVQVHDVGTTPEGISYFVMEKLEGTDLRHAMKQGSVTRGWAIDIVIDVLSALEYVHQRGIVHRDIKPENIFLAEQPSGTVTKVLDFGIVHIFDSDGSVSKNRITKTGGFVGTLYYAAPEQMQGRPAGPANDVYAAGLVLFELLAGRGPFDDDPGVGLSRCFKPAPRLTDIIPQAPHLLSDVLAKALEQDPMRRPTAGSLAADLRSAAAALKNPGQADVVREDVHALLRNMAPLGGSGTLRPAEGTASPPTPVMGGLPGASGPLERTMASEVPGAPAVQGQAPGTTPGVGGPGAPAQRASAPSFPGNATLPTGPQPQPAGAEAHAVSAVPASPRFPLAGAAPRSMNTSPGVYATVDVVSGASPAARKTPMALIMAAVAAPLAVLTIVGAVFILRNGSKGKEAEASTTPSASASIVAASSPPASPPPPPEPAETTAVDAGSPVAAAAEASPAAAAKPTPVSPANAGAARRPAPQPQPAMQPAPKPATSPAKPKPSDEYVKTL